MTRKLEIKEKCKKNLKYGDVIRTMWYTLTVTANGEAYLMSLTIRELSVVEAQASINKVHRIVSYRIIPIFSLRARFHRIRFVVSIDRLTGVCSLFADCIRSRSLYH